MLPSLIPYKRRGFIMNFIINSNALFILEIHIDLRIEKY